MPPSDQIGFEKNSVVCPEYYQFGNFRPQFEIGNFENLHNSWPNVASSCVRPRLQNDPNPTWVRKQILPGARARSSGFFVDQCIRDGGDDDKINNNVGRNYSSG